MECPNRFVEYQDDSLSFRRDSWNANEGFIEYPKSFANGLNFGVNLVYS